MEEWAEIFDLMSDGVSVHDTDFTILNANKALCEMLGKAKEEIVGQKCYRIFHGKDTPVEDCVFEKTCKTGGHQTAEIFEPWIDSWLAVTSSPIFDRHGKCKKTIHIVRDITDRKRTEEEKERLMIDHMEALSMVNVLKSLLPICAGCKKIRDDDGQWEQIEVYIRDKTGTEFSHGMCPDCTKKLYPSIDISKIEKDEDK